MRYLGGMGFGRMGGVVVGERVAWEEGGAPTRGQSGGCTSEGILSMMMARLCLCIIISSSISILSIISSSIQHLREAVNPDGKDGLSKLGKMLK